MRIANVVAVMVAGGLLPVWAQEIRLPASLDRLAEKAEEAVDVTMNKTMLQMAARFLSDRRDDEAQTKKVLAGLDSVTVRSFDFLREGEYSAGDVEAVRGQLTAPAWSRIVGVKSKRTGGNVDVYFKSGVNGQLGGIVVIAAEPTSLTIVNVVGTIDPSQLADLGGQFGIPRLDMGNIVMRRRDYR